MAKQSPRTERPSEEPSDSSRFSQSEVDPSESDLSLDAIRNAMEFLAGVRSDLEKPAAETRKVLTADTETGNIHSEGVPGATATEIPQHIGRFEIKRLLGRGGFAKVYLARDPNLDRQVALKILSPSLHFSAEAAARFDREARAAAILSHPNIVPIFETGRDGPDRFIASSYCSGTTLREWFEERNRRLEPKLAAEIVSKLAEATEHAHERGIVHRDLKPANILVEPIEARADATGESTRSPTITPGIGKLQIADFGLAKYTCSMDQLETSEGAIVGTPAYMSPEQAVGSRDINGVSDIYSLGVILYELLTGELPILGDTHIETLLAISRDEPAAPRKVDSAIPKDLEAICLKCLHKNPARRYLSAHELAQDLRRWLNGEVVLARRASPAEKLRKWCARNPALALAFVGISAALIIAIFQWRNALRENSRANRQLNRADRHVAMTQNVIDEMVTRVAKDPKLPPELRRNISQRAVDLQAQLLAEEPDDPAIVKQTALAHRRFAELLHDLGEFEIGLRAVEESLELVDSLTDEPEFAKLRMESIRVKSTILNAMQLKEEAIKTLVEATKDIEQTAIDDARNAFQLGMSRLRQQQHDEAVLEFENAQALFNALDGGHVLANEIALTDLYCGKAEMELGNFDRAKTKLLAALDSFSAIHTSSPAKEDPIECAARCHMTLARVARRKFNETENPASEDFEGVEEARLHFDRAAKLFLELIDLNPLKSRTHGQLAATYEIWIRLEVEQGSGRQAKQVMDRFADLYQIIPVSLRERPIVGRILVESRLKIAGMFLEKGEMDAAVDQLRKGQLFLGTLMADYPGVERLEDLREQCDRLVNENAS